MNVTIVLFPGTNCDHDIVYTYSSLLGVSTKVVWHRDTDLGTPDLVVLPGGFSYGDYLRAGALAKLSPIMEEVIRFARSGGPVLGICNGFQVLCEVGLLPGVLLRNVRMRFLSEFLFVKTTRVATPFTTSYSDGEVLRFPVAHFDGNYFADPETLSALEDNGQVVFRYCNADGVVDEHDQHSNPNGSVHAIAGICSVDGNIVGMMPHPERSAQTLVGSVGADQGLRLFSSALS